MPKTHVIQLTATQRDALLRLIDSGSAAARTLTHARILLHADTRADHPGWPDAAIADALLVGRATVERVRKRFVGGGLDAALYRKPRLQGVPTKMDGVQEAHLIAMTCAAPPQGHKRWTLRLLANGMVEAGYLDGLSHETVRQVLKKTNSSRG